MKRVLVTGATGNVGRHVASRLLASNCLVRALTRNPETASVPPGVEAVRGDLTGGAALDACLEGVDAVFLVWTTPAGRCAMRRCRGNKRTGNGFPPVILTMLLDAWSAALGQPAFVTSTFNDVTGMSPRTFREWVVENARAFQAQGIRSIPESPFDTGGCGPAT